MEVRELQNKINLETTSDCVVSVMSGSTFPVMNHLPF